MNSSHTPLRYLATALAVVGTCFILDPAVCRAEPSDTGDEQGIEVLTRGPVHEAFAGVVVFNPEPGVVVPKSPPNIIEEVPPEEKPEGSNVTWIPGYWAWDDERNDFLWVSGVWRALPPGRQWVTGYWAKSGTGFQWTSGYWADAKVTQTTYLPAPPATLETGPNIAAPSPDYYWAPGCWVWYDYRYAWRPGYWVAGRPDWVWCPAYYSWTPRGYVFVDGYWDYSIGYRGVLFAPVYFGYGGVYARPGYYYSPHIVIDLAVFPDHLFFRPHYHHCYFGDYYAASYYSAGFYASFSFQSRRYGYDPIYCHRRWEHRHDRNWEHQVAANYRHRRDHVDARPPRTWAAQRSITTVAHSKDRSLAVATSFDQLSKRKDSPRRFEPVTKVERQQIVQRDQEVRKVRDERRTLESNAVTAPKAKRGKQFEPSTAKLPQSPYVSQSSDRLGKEQSPPTYPRQVARPGSNIVPKREAPTRDPNLNRYDRQPEPPRSGYRERPVPAQPQSKSEPNRPAKEKQREADKGETRKEHKGQQDKDEEQK